MIIGITGTLGAGKGTIVEYLLKKGFKHYSVRSFLVEEIMKRGLESNRDNMVFVANELRAQHGPSYIVEKLYSRAVEIGGDAVVESIRCVGEIDALKLKKDFSLFAVDADIETRYARIVERGSSSDIVSFEEFVQQEQREMVSNNPLKQNLQKCIEMADYTFKNDWTIKELHEKVENILNKIKGGVEEKHVRPTWDEYFLKLAMLASERSTCPRMHCGCILVKNKNVIATGYNGSIPGDDHCEDVGCLVVDNHCLRTNHAEMNALMQAAKQGNSVEGACAYVTNMSCTTCAKALIASGIKRVVVFSDYHDTLATEFFAKAEVIIEKHLIPSKKIKYDLKGYSSVRA